MSAKHQPDQPLLALQNVTVRYEGGKIGLENINLALEAGTRVAVVGPNGAGKSTLFRLIVGEARPSQGQIHVGGSSPDHHICIAYVPQRNNIDWSFPVTVSDVVMMGRVGRLGYFHRPRQADRQIVRDSLKRVQLLNLADRQIGQLSGGQQQRVFIARALAQEAELLLLDEPFSGLDELGRDNLFTILDTIEKSGVTALVAIHDLNLAAARFQRILLLNKKVLAFGPPDQVLIPDHLVAAYSGHLHTVGDLIIADSCYESDDDKISQLQT